MPVPSLTTDPTLERTGKEEIYYFLRPVDEVPCIRNGNGMPEPVHQHVSHGFRLGLVLLAFTKN